MGFTNVVWASRGTEQLARDLTDGPGPATVGGAGASWVRVANEFAGVSADFDKLQDRLRTVWESQASSAAAQRLDEFGKWLQAVSLSAAANGQRAEEAAVAHTVAVMAMPSVSEAIETKAAQDMMASLAAYNGAVLTGNFAEFDEAATADQANAAGVMNQYEQAVAHLAQPWEQPAPPDVTNADALAAEKNTASESGGGLGRRQRGRWRSGTVAASADVRSGRPIEHRSEEPAQDRIRFHGGLRRHGPWWSTRRSPQWGRWAAPTAVPTTNQTSPQPLSMAQVNRRAGLSDAGQSWLPSAAQNDSPFMVSSVSWGPDTAVFDELVVPDEPQVEGFAEEPGRTLEQIDDRWVSPAVIGVDRELKL